MRKPDHEVKEVVCSVTGKPMPKIPLWMAGIKVKFVCDEARQKTSAATMADIELARHPLNLEIEDVPDIDADDVEDADEVEADEEITDDDVV